jgi:hypothetical protein
MPNWGSDIWMKEKSIAVTSASLPLAVIRLKRAKPLIGPVLAVEV